ncbi:MAG: glycosyltransferase family 4 protein [Candidatus Omnitrophica bacterium]|nr:glycosyltransferase family 4 protein [Candidatus Omnitrophota bacterium]
MKILFDNQIFFSQRYGGISRYFTELIKHLNQYDDVEAVLPMTLSENIHLPRRLKLPLDALCTMDFRGKYRMLRYINKRLSVNVLKKRKYDIFHPTYYDPYYLSLDIQKPVVITVFDMIHELFPSYFPPYDETRDMKKTAVGKADRIIAISQSTKKDLCLQLNVAPEKVTVIYLASSLSNVPLKKTAVPEKYLLFVGTRYGYKNFEFFITAIAPLLKDKKVFIFCAGGGAFNESEQKLFAETGLQDYIFYKEVSDEELKYCYKNAIAFVLPSLYEGFGLPVVEAFSCGCPVLLSDCSSLPEVAGDAGLYFNPLSKESIFSAVSIVLDTHFDRQKYIEKGYSLSKNFTWEKTTEKTLSLYRELL